MTAPSKLVERATRDDDVEELVRLAWSYSERQPDGALGNALWTVASRLHGQGKGPELARLLRLPENPYLASTMESIQGFLISLGPSVGLEVMAVADSGPPESLPRAERVLAAIGMNDASAGLRGRIEERERRFHDIGPTEDDPFPPLPNEGLWIRLKRRRLRRYFLSPNRWMGGKKPWDA